MTHSHATLNELDWLKRWAKYSPSAVAIQDGETGESWTYLELYNLSCAGAEYLEKKFGIKAGDRVAVVAANDPMYVPLFFSIARLGAIMVPVNFRLTAREVGHIVQDSAAALVVYQDEFSATIEQLPSSITKWNWESDDSGLAAFFKQKKKFTSGRAREFTCDPEQIAMILYTSGTTGAPKGAMISHRAIFWNSVNTGLRLNLSSSDVHVHFMPFFHTGGWNVLLTPFLHRGARSILLKKFDAQKVLELSEREGATILFGVPTTLNLMAQASIFADLKLAQVRYAIVGGEPMPIDLIRTWESKGVRIRQGYGLTEFGPNVFSLNEEDSVRKIGSIGFANFYIETRVVDNDGVDVSADEIGELWLRGPMCMSGYWQNPTATTETITDGWLRTGDLVRFDSEGYFYVSGRKKDMFISGGENVYPVEVEQVLSSHPLINEVAVIGCPDEKWGEVGHAFVVAKSGASLDSEELRRYCLAHLAKFKIPKYFSPVPSLPKGDSGKILKRELRLHSN